MRAALIAFGEEAYYGVTLIELVPAPIDDTRLILGRLQSPGHILLFDQPKPPWRLGFQLAPELQARVFQAGAIVDDAGILHWPGDSLRRFMLGDVLAHELGHHRLQHERRLRGERGARTSDHEARADIIANQLRMLVP